jgi:hypothetical protein
MAHSAYEGTLQLLVNRGPMTGALTIMFNPNGINNSRLIPMRDVADSRRWPIPESA